MCPSPAPSWSWSQRGELKPKPGKYNLAERREELGGSERRRLSLKRVGFQSKRSRVTIKWSWVKRGRKTET